MKTLILIKIGVVDKNKSYKSLFPTTNDRNLADILTFQRNSICVEDSKAMWIANNL